jgi:FMN-dependent NADH-azoreductase
MPILLHIDSSARRHGSVSRELSAAFADAWRGKHPTGTVTYRDLAETRIPHVDEDSLSAGFVLPEQRTPAQRSSFGLNEQLVAELLSADEIVLGVPMYNFTVPSTFKAYVDRIVVPGLTLDVETGQGLVTGKRTTVVSARGGSYAPGTPREGYDFQEPWIRAALGLIGIDDVRFIHAEMTLANVNPKLAQFKHIADQSLSDAQSAVRDAHGVAVA